MPPPRLGFVGDSIALTLGYATSQHQQRELYRPAPWATEIGCGLARFQPESGQECEDPVQRIAGLPADSIDVGVDGRIVGLF